jgi:hypothetical protein
VAHRLGGVAVNVDESSSIAVSGAVDTPVQTTIRCYAHDDVEATGSCTRCQRALCDTCAVSIPGRLDPKDSGESARGPRRLSCPDCVSSVRGARRTGAPDYVGPITSLAVALSAIVSVTVLSAKGGMLPWSRGANICAFLVSISILPAVIVWAVWLGRCLRTPRGGEWLSFTVAIALLGPLVLGLVHSINRLISLFQAVAHVVRSPDKRVLLDRGIPDALIPLRNSFVVSGTLCAASIVVLGALTVIHWRSRASASDSTASQR